jgi:hypothetical protein
MDAEIKPLLFFLNLIIQFRKCPGLPSLQPDEFVSVVDFAVLVQAGEEASFLVF